MFIGHALLAFALAVLVAEWRGWPTHRAFAIGIATGLFAAAPDVDMLWTVVAIEPSELVVGTRIQPGEFWGSAHGIHRSMTHSLVAAAVAGPAFGLWTLRRSRGADPLGWSTDDASGTDGFDRHTLVSVALALAGLSVLVTAAVLASGFVGGFVMTAFVLAGLAIATASRIYLGLSPVEIGIAAVAGIASHPWGDLVTGEPPALLYPFDVQLISERVLLSGDPTLHLLGAFAIELAAVTIAAIVLARAADLDPIRLVDRRAAAGVLYGAGAVVMVPPTINLSYHFVFSILTVGVVLGGLRRSPRSPYSLRNLYHRFVGDPEAALRTTFTALAGIAVALVSYAVVYLAL
ncbi:membrane-bound metal-dependent hydrolase [Salinarchaeum sp. Harcht-Bsk1]|uniref:metal-dependent hydrolase n=1 Tax=Salinarchaeum sp. Harcht-Bsk1 TaxID=1333523 RepID=UPI00034246FD|nr:metal-dependent hydrolase [Salinarchaeum sp. Harcht-Bsk1]AGN00371.1 membrane-bound metal-dependent hydrolase [Salinarchaeum sp. Harcht-Bsk1]